MTQQGVNARAPTIDKNPAANLADEPEQRHELIAVLCAGPPDEFPV